MPFFTLGSCFKLRRTCSPTLRSVTTFATTPLTLAFYPAWYRTKTERERRGLPGVPPPRDGSSGGGFGEEPVRSRFAVVIEQFEHLPAIMSFLRLLVPPPSISKPSSPSPPPSSPSPSTEKESGSDAVQQQQQPDLAFLRLVENTDRTSALLRAAESETALLRADTLAAVLKAFATGLGAKIRHFALSIAAPDAYPQQVAEFVEVHDSQVAVVPWLLPASATATGPATAPTSTSASAATESAPGVAESWLPNPFEGLFTGARSISAHGAAEYANYVRHLFAESPSDVAVFLERAQTDSAIQAGGRAHLFLAFHGGSDDRFALALVDQLVRNHAYLTASVVRITRAGEPTEHDQAIIDGDDVTKATTRDSSAAATTTTQSDEPLFTLTRGGGGAPNGDTIYPSIMGAGRGLQSETEDDVLWSRLVASSSDASSNRIEFSTASSHRPLRLALARLAAVRSQCAAESVPVIVFAGRGRRDAPSHTKEALALFKERNGTLLAQSVVVSSEVRRALGDVASMYVLEGEKGTEDRIVVLQKGGKRGRVPGRSTVIVEEDEAAGNPKAA